ncbi:hypothetical protein [Streptomyces hygroscopicus]|uniref:hypothetical protein n=1 Tax=Streptomyces hygroscopicus TaxID=1912 RepID=UPI00131D1590|nr:hypothetical protein [Streptomyces hygroscopicus]
MGRPPMFGKGDYRQRHAVECGDGPGETPQVCSPGYDQLAVRHGATVLLALRKGRL